MRCLLISAFIAIMAAAGCAAPEPEQDDRRVEYQVSGSACAASLTYENAGGNTQQEASASLPWTYGFTVKGEDADGFFLYIAAQNLCDYGDITATIRVDGRTEETSTSTGGHTIASASTSL